MRKIKMTEELEKIMDEYNVGYDTARYIKGRLDKGLDYNPRPRRGLSKKELAEAQINIIKDEDEEFGWLIKRRNKKVPIHILTSKTYTNGIRQYPGIVIRMLSEGDTEKKQRIISLNSLLYAFFKEDIPAGYVVDHIDNNPFNNELENFQLLTIGGNVKKDHVGHNQFTPLEELVHSEPLNRDPWEK